MIDTSDAAQYKTFIKAALTKVAGPQHVELYWYMLEIFTDHDTDKDGIIKQTEFPEMMNQFLATPRKLGLTCPTEVSSRLSHFISAELTVLLPGPVRGSLPEVRPQEGRQDDRG